MQEILAGLAERAAAAPPLLTLGLVFAGGVLSSASPCVLAAVPLIVATVGGGATSRRRALLLSGAFAVGLAACFTLLGAVAAMTGRLIGDIGSFWKLILGIILVTMGAYLAGWIKWQGVALDAEKFRGGGIPAALLLGALTGTLSSPCATPILVVLLSLVAFEHQVVWGTILLAAYSLGHVALLFAAGAISGVAATLVSSRFARWGERLHRGFGWITMALGLWVIYLFATG